MLPCMIGSLVRTLRTAGCRLLGSPVLAPGAFVPLRFVSIRRWLLVLGEHAQLLEHLGVAMPREYMRVKLTLPFQQAMHQGGVEVLNACSGHHLGVIHGLGMLLHKSFDLIPGHPAVTIAGADEGAAVRAERSHEAGFVAWKHLFDLGEDQIAAFEGAGHDGGAHHGRHLLTGLAQGLLHRTGIEALHRCKTRFFRKPEDDIASGTVGECRKRVRDGGGELAFALFDFALLRVVADDAHQLDEFGHLRGVVIIPHGVCLFRSWTHTIQTQTIAIASGQREFCHRVGV